MRGVILLIIILLSITAVSAELKPAGFIQSEFENIRDKHEDGTPGVKLGNPNNIEILGNYAYITAAGSDALQIIDISNPKNPKPAGFIQSHFKTNGYAHEDGTPGVKLVSPSDLEISGNYAYIIAFDSNSMLIVDISNPYDPKPAGLIHDYGKLNGPNQIIVRENYAYIITKKTSAMQIIDISDPDNPILAGFIHNGMPGVKILFPNDFEIEGNYAYITAAGSDALQIIDISDPYDPKPAGSIQSEFNLERRKYEHGTPGVKLAGAKDITIEGNYAYILAWEVGALQIVDISDPYNPKPAGFIQGETYRGTPGVKFGGLRDIKIIEDYAYITTDGGLQIIDISDPYNPKPTGFIQDENRKEGTPGVKLQYPQEIEIVGNYAYVTASDALQIIDISDPYNPKPAGFIQSELNKYANNNEDGTPGVKLALASDIEIVGNYAYITATGSDALQIIDISNVGKDVTINSETYSQINTKDTENAKQNSATTNNQNLETTAEKITQSNQDIQEPIANTKTTSNNAENTNSQATNQRTDSSQNTNTETTKGESEETESSEGIQATVEEYFGFVIDKIPLDDPKQRFYAFVAAIGVVIYFVLFRK